MAVAKIPLEAVSSSNIAAAGYDHERRILAIQFKTDHAIRNYADVPPELAAAFYGSESKGRFYHAQIRGKFTGRPVTGPCRACKATGYVGDPCPCGRGAHVALEKHRGEPEA